LLIAKTANSCAHLSFHLIVNNVFRLSFTHLLSVTRLFIKLALRFIVILIFRQMLLQLLSYLWVKTAAIIITLFSWFWLVNGFRPRFRGLNFPSLPPPPACGSEISKDEIRVDFNWHLPLLKLSDSEHLRWGRDKLVVETEWEIRELLLPPFLLPAQDDNAASLILRRNFPIWNLMCGPNLAITNCQSRDILNILVVQSNEIKNNPERFCLQMSRWSFIFRLHGSIDKKYLKNSSRVSLRRAFFFLPWK
jgi:hypothetical protein